MTKEQELELKLRTKKPIMCLDISDSYGYRDPKLIKLIKEKYDKLCTKPRKGLNNVF